MSYRIHTALAREVISDTRLHAEDLDLTQLMFEDNGNQEIWVLTGTPDEIRTCLRGAIMKAERL